MYYYYHPSAGTKGTNGDTVPNGFLNYANLRLLILRARKLKQFKLLQRRLRNVRFNLYLYFGNFALLAIFIFQCF